MCTRACIHVHVCTHVQVYMYALCMHSSMPAHMGVCMWLHVCMNVYICMHIHMCVLCTCPYVCAHGCARGCVWTHEMACPQRRPWRGHFCALHHLGSWPPMGTRNSASQPGQPHMPPVPGWPPPRLLSPLLAHLAPRDGFLHTVLMTRSSRLALIRFHKTSPAVSSGSVITISFRFKET